MYRPAHRVPTVCFWDLSKKKRRLEIFLVEQLEKAAFLIY
ncbi:hypothetical protein PTH_1469 [Pelotomaculum thermopropionicum SI]|uniref:Uncharacterized protein n=1 Tax=Pelotomaculum thermopropionicum (strain DSM 13744 / JCM 10971 / SI) TaxID=370438 RepID=A5D281_PELTS|nr:hypothetical protein PTH_1469 [Pelotomaculum thermopropionicum SI]